MGIPWTPHAPPFLSHPQLSRDRDGAARQKVCWLFVQIGLSECNPLGQPSRRCFTLGAMYKNECNSRASRQKRVKENAHLYRSSPRRHSLMPPESFPQWATQLHRNCPRTRQNLEDRKFPHQVHATAGNFPPQNRMNILFSRVLPLLERAGKLESTDQPLDFSQRIRAVGRGRRAWYLHGLAE